MKKKLISVLGAVGLFCWMAPASAWWQWYQYDTPFVPAPTVGAPGMWFYNSAPVAPIPGLNNPGMWFLQNLPFVPTQFWSIPAMPTTSSGVFVEQLQLPMGYGFRVHSGDPGLQVNVRVDGGGLVIRSQNAVQSSMGPGSSFQTGSSTQWVSLPMDANPAGMTISRKPGMIEIFIPRR